MNEQLMQALSQLMATISTGLTQGVAFAQDQLPDVIIQLLWWEGVYSFLMFLSYITFVIITCRFCFVQAKAYKAAEVAKDESYDSFEDPAYFFRVVGGGALLFVTSPLPFALLDWLKILIAPKVWLIEYAGALVK